MIRMSQHTNQRHNYAIAQDTHKRNIERSNKPGPAINGLVFEETGFKNSFNSIAFKGSLEPSHETHPVPETQPHIYDCSGSLDIQERRKAMVERMVKARVGLEIFNARMNTTVKE